MHVVMHIVMHVGRAKVGPMHGKEFKVFHDFMNLLKLTNIRTNMLENH